jgi:DnaJ-class molecular chaperone
MTDAFAQWRDQVLATAKRLDEIDYFRLLGCTPEASPADVRRAFRQLANGYHPDRFVGQDETLCVALEAIYRRVTEAYAILRDPKERAAYSAGLDQGLTRYDPDQSHQALQQSQDAQLPGATAEGRRHYERAQTALARGDRYSAQEEVRMALLFEPSEPAFLNLAKDLQGS